MARPSWDEYFMQLARAVAERATCDRGKSGCIIVKNKRVLCTGYVGSTPGMPHCDEAGHLLRKVTYENGETKEHCMRTIHAEQNAILQAAKFGISIDGATIYCKMTPCRNCAMAISNAGIQRVVAEKDYQAGQDSKEIFKVANIELAILNPEVEAYANVNPVNAAINP